MIPFGKKWRRIIESTLANYNINGVGKEPTGYHYPTPNSLDDK
jgi:hypothetical protein